MRSSPVDRRQFLASGLTLAGATLLGCSPDEIISPPLSAGMEPDQVRALDGDLSEPAVISSTAGILATSITCGTTPAFVGGRRVHQPVTYNGTFPGPTLVVRPGDTLDIRFTNKIVFDQAGTKPGYGRPPRDSSATNLHYHGMHVSPIGTADDMLIVVQPNGRYRYLFQIPFDHPAGLFWWDQFRRISA